MGWEDGESADQANRRELVQRHCAAVGRNLFSSSIFYYIKNKWAVLGHINRLYWAIHRVCMVQLTYLCVYINPLLVPSSVIV
jgi:hypothetical protein